MSTITNPQKINQILERRVEKIYPSKEALRKVLLSGKKLRLYLGIDPTAVKLHLGHTVPLRTLQAFADLGHEVILLFGTGTVLVGDPSLRETGRKKITQKEIEKNVKTWKKQVEPIINFSKVKIKYNGDWLIKLRLKDIIYLGSLVTALQLFKRESFTRRIKAGDTVWYYETLYPLLQGYDSVAMNVDLEIGGTDQTFNMLIGREMQKKVNNKEKFVVALKMIAGTNGKNMSKTSGNCIWLTDTPKDIFGKLMTVQDQLIPDYLEFFTKTAMEEIKKTKEKLKKDKNPMLLKKQMAFKITALLKGEKEAQQARREFEKVHQQNKTPTNIPTFPLSKLSKNPINPVDLLVETNLAPSRTETKRLITQKAVKLNQSTINNLPAGKAGQQSTINVKSDDILKVGKHRWLKFI